MSEDHDINKSIDNFLSEPEPTSSDIAVKIGIAIFLAITSAYFVREAYEQYRLQQLANSLNRSARSFNLQMDRMHARTQQQLRVSVRESQKRLREINAKNEIRAKELARKQYLNNYWKDIGNGTFINVGRSKRSGDLATAVIKVANRQVSVNVNCNNETYWSNQNNGWFSPTGHFSTEYKMIRTACSTKD